MSSSSAYSGSAVDLRPTAGVTEADIMAYFKVE
jgi:hypothetical protein